MQRAQAIVQLLRRLILQSPSPTSSGYSSLLKVHGCLGLCYGAMKGPEIEEEGHSRGRVLQGEGIVYIIR